MRFLRTPLPTGLPETLLLGALAFAAAWVLTGCGPDEPGLDWEIRGRGVVVDHNSVYAIASIVAAEASLELDADVLGQFAGRRGFKVEFFHGPLRPDVSGLYYGDGIQVRRWLPRCLAHTSLVHELVHLAEDLNHRRRDPYHTSPLYWGPGGIQEQASRLAWSVVCDGESSEAQALAVEDSCAFAESQP